MTPPPPVPSRRSGGSCMPRGWSRPSRTSARAARGAASRPRMPNEVWQSDMTHWRLADGTEVEICSWLDDHSRYLLGCTAFGGSTATTWWPRSVRRARPRLPGRHAHRQRRDLHLALHRRPQRLRAPARLARHPSAERGTRTSPDPGQDRALPPDAEALARAAARRADPRRAAGPARYLPARLRRGATAPGHRPTDPGRGLPGDAEGPARRSAAPGATFRLRYDTVDKAGAMTLRRAGRLHHLGIGAAHRGRRVLAIVDEREVTVVDLETGEVLSTHRIEPDRGYWRNQRRDPGRWPGSQATR